jgi:predicted dehydrogenase
MKFLIAGLGSIGRRHLRNLLALGERDIVLYRTGKSTLPEDELQEFVTETDLSEALNHNPDAVIVANPTAFHLDVAVPAAEAGCHLLIEKPVSHNLEGIDELRSAVEQSGTKVLVGYQYRFHPGLMEIHEWLREERIGKVFYARAHWGEYLPDWHPWEDYQASYAARAEMGGGVLVTLSHPIDYLRWLIGEAELSWISTCQSGNLELDVEDTADLWLRFGSGATASLHLDYLQRPPDHHLLILGTEGTCRWDNKDGSSQISDAQTGDWLSYVPEAGFERNRMFIDELQHFIRVIAGDDEPKCTLDDGIAVLKLVQPIK